MQMVFSRITMKRVVEARMEALWRVKGVEVGRVHFVVEGVEASCVEYEVMDLFSHPIVKYRF